MSDYSVWNEPDFAPTYHEMDEVTIRKGDLRAILDVATMSMDFGSGFLDNEQVEALRKAAVILGIDPLYATPSNFTQQYASKEHKHIWREHAVGYKGRARTCVLCHHSEVLVEPVPRPAPPTTGVGWV